MRFYGESNLQSDQSMIRGIVYLWIAVLSLTSCLSPEEVLKLQDAVVMADFKTAEPLFEKHNFAYHTPDLFSKTTDPAPTFQLLTIINANGLFPMITEDDVRSFSTNICFQLCHHVRKIGSPLRHMTLTCFAALSSRMDTRDAKYIPIEFARMYPNAFSKAFPYFHVYSPQQLAEVSSVPVACQNFNAHSFQYMESRTLYKAMNPKCLSQMDGVQKADFGKAMKDRKIPGDFFSFYCGPLREDAYYFMTPDHVSLIGIKCYHKDVRFPLPMERLNANALKGVTPRLFSEWVECQEKIDNLGWTWQNFRDDIFSRFVTKEYYEVFVPRLDPKNYEYMTPLQLNNILKFPEICKLIPETAILSSQVLKYLKVSSKCFANLHPNHQYKFLTSELDLPENIMEHMGHKHIDHLKYGFYTLNKMKMRNRGAILENLSSKVKPQYHACRLIQNLGVLKNLTIFRRESMPKGCWKQLGFKIKVKHVLKEPKLFAGRPKALKAILRNERRVENFSRLSRKDMERLTDGEAGIECKHMTFDQFSKFPPAVISGLSPLCVANLTFIQELHPDVFQFFGSRSFSYVGREHLDKVDLECLLNPHLEYLSSALNMEDSAGHALTKDVLENKITPERLNYLPARLWANVPVRSFTIFRTPDIIGRMSGEKMAYWRLDQVLMIPKKVLATINQDQADSLGSLYKDKQALARYLKTIKFETNEIKMILADRFEDFEVLPSMDEAEQESIRIAEGDEKEDEPEPQKSKPKKKRTWYGVYHVAAFIISAAILLAIYMALVRLRNFKKIQ